jgi:CMP-N,N'-diacetyllegionaminic acid synthase
MDMRQAKNIIGLVPARSGSKGVIDKNVRIILGKTLIEHAVESGMNCDLINKKIWVSTDSKDYEKKAIGYGAKSLGLREAHLAGDRVKTSEVIKNFVGCYLESGEKLDYLVLLQPTSPLREENLIESCINKCVETGEVVTTIARHEEPHPYKMYKEDSLGNIVPFLEDMIDVPRQALPKVFVPTGAVYCYPVEMILSGSDLKPSKFIETESFVNIDNKVDIEMANILMSKER